MVDIILEKLKAIEHTENVQIIHAVESGSRAWGFASPDSDYDVRFIYMRGPKEYLRLDFVKDTIEWQLDEILDINGWDVKKALQLAYKVNPTLLEWNHSPVVYRTSNIWQSAIKQIDEQFSPQPVLHHYYSMAVNNYEHFRKDETLFLKRYFYAIRPILAMKWILQKETPPPVLFTDLLEEEKGNVPYHLIEDVLAHKKNMPERVKEKRIDELDKFIEKELFTLDKTLQNLPSYQPKEWHAMNELFLQILNSQQR